MPTVQPVYYNVDIPSTADTYKDVAMATENRDYKQAQVDQMKHASSIQDQQMQLQKDEADRVVFQNTMSNLYKYKYEPMLKNPATTQEQLDKSIAEDKAMNPSIAKNLGPDFSIRKTPEGVVFDNIHKIATTEDAKKYAVYGIKAGVKYAVSEDMNGNTKWTDLSLTPKDQATIDIAKSKITNTTNAKNKPKTMREAFNQYATIVSKLTESDGSITPENQERLDVLYADLETEFPGLKKETVNKNDQYASQRAEAKKMGRILAKYKDPKTGKEVIGGILPAMAKDPKYKVL